MTAVNTTGDSRLSQRMSSAEKYPAIISFWQQYDLADLIWSFDAENNRCSGSLLIRNCERPPLACHLIKDSHFFLFLKFLVKGTLRMMKVFLMLFCLNLSIEEAALYTMLISKWVSEMNEWMANCWINRVIQRCLNNRFAFQFDYKVGLMHQFGFLFEFLFKTFGVQECWTKSNKRRLPGTVSDDRSKVRTLEAAGCVNTKETLTI